MAVILVNVRAAKVVLLLLQRLRSVFSLYMILKVIIQPMSHCGTAARQLFVLPQLNFIFFTSKLIRMESGERKICLCIFITC